VNLQVCVRSASRKRALERLVKRQKGVVLLWNETPSGERKRCKR
jgi:hypothetical protein